MGEFFNSYRSPQDTLFEGDKRRSSMDLFEGDFYIEDDHVVRGLSFAPAFQNLSDGKLHGIQSRALVLPGEPSVDLEVKPVFAGKTYYSSASVTDLATGILEYLNQLDSVVKLKSTKRALSAEVCKNFQVHKLKVSFYVPTEAQDTVAVTWERKAGDGLEFNSTVVGAEKALADRGLDLSRSEWACRNLLRSRLRCSHRSSQKDGGSIVQPKGRGHLIFCSIFRRWKLSRARKRTSSPFSRWQRLTQSQWPRQQLKCAEWSMASQTPRLS
jgi:hypothetical protein